jgi:chromosome segregation ATPase
MATEQGHSQEFDLDKTDRLPILTGDFLDPDIADDAVKMAGPDMETMTQSSYLETTAERPVLTEGQALMTNAPALTTSSLPMDFIRPSAIDLPSLAESLRSVEERIAHQQSEYEVLSRSFERARDGEESAKTRAGQLEADLAAAWSLLESEQARAREQEKNLTERTVFFEAARTRAEEALRDSERSQAEALRESERDRSDALRESERHQGEARLLKDSLAARDATISQVLHSLGERDAQLNALLQEHAKAQQSLEARGRTSSQLEADLGTTKLAVQEMSAQLAASKESVATLAARLKRSDTEVNTIRTELGATRTQAASYLELLRTHEYRRGFEDNLFLEMDAKVGVADAGHNALKAECERLLAQAANQDLKVAAQGATIEKLQSNVSAQTATLAKQAHDLKQIETARSELNQRLTATEADLQRVSADLAQREAALKESRSSAAADSQRMSALLASAEQRQVEQAAQFAKQHAEHIAAVAKMQADHTATLTEMQTDHASKVSYMQNEQMSHVNELQSTYTAGTARAEAEHAAEMERQKALHGAYVADAEARAQQREQEMSVLMAHLLEARRPLEPIEADVKRLTEALATKTAAFDEIDAEARKLRASLERTRGALEEREFLIRRLERSESNNANVLGRIQTSMERLGSGRITPSSLGNLPECTAELIRVDGGRTTSHTLGRRTRIGRGAGCELQVESSSVSRHHALIVVGPRDTIVEDLNSTNGVILNGRKITRAFLTDGDTLIVGEVQFRYVAKAGNRPAPQPPLEPAPVN